jgi:hypothetical protein
VKANDAKLVVLFTAQRGSEIEDDVPNTPGRGQEPATAFDLLLEAAAGSVLGSSGAHYSLTATCIDETIQQTVPSMSIGPLQQAFSTPTWIRSGSDFMMRQRFSIAVSANVSGHVFCYLGALMSGNRQIVSFAESNRFVLV